MTWIKMRGNLAEDPAVIDMAARLGTDEFAVVGRLHTLWAWADAQSRDGHATGVTASWINRKVQRDGFAEVMVAVQWLVIDEAGIRFPNFERHNGESAKTRALGTNRKQNQRAKGNVTPDDGDESRSDRDRSETREEKRREEEEIPTAGEACKAMKSAGLALVNPSNQELIDTLKAGVSIAALVSATEDHPGKPLSYVLKAAMTRHTKASALPLPAERQAGNRTAPRSFAEQERETKMAEWEQMTGRVHPDRYRNERHGVVDVAATEIMTIGGAHELAH